MNSRFTDAVTFYKKNEIAHVQRTNVQTSDTYGIWLGSHIAHNEMSTQNWKCILKC